MYHVPLVPYCICDRLCCVSIVCFCVISLACVLADRAMDFLPSVMLGRDVTHLVHLFLIRVGRRTRKKIIDAKSRGGVMSAGLGARGWNFRIRQQASELGEPSGFLARRLDEAVRGVVDDDHECARTAWRECFSGTTD